MSLYRRYHERFGTAGVVLGVIALILALGGSAFAAKGGLSGAEKKLIKKEAKKWGKKFAKKGPQGPAGANGTNGKDGTNGTNGTNGTDGADGKDGVDGKNGVLCPEGECKLESGATLTGVWAATLDELERESVSISYPVQVAPAPTSLAVPNAGLTEGFVFDPESGALIGFMLSAEEVDAYCPGDAANPKAAPETLCIYTSTETTGASVNIVDGVFGSPDPSSGQPLPLADFSAGNGGYVDGTWAVTAE